MNAALKGNNPAERIGVLASPEAGKGLGGAYATRGEGWADRACSWSSETAGASAAICATGPR